MKPHVNMICVLHVRALSSICGDICKALYVPASACVKMMWNPGS